jgi:Fe-S oxidoreductase/FAD/FMN-containing dehydrogenase
MDMRTLERDLKEIVGERVTTSEFERWFYTGDFVPIPNWVKAFFKTMPVAIVKPGTVEEVSGLLRYCFEKNIPVVPRGGGTSGLFGAVPKKGGVVFDLRGLSGIIEIDSDKKTVNVQAGLTWWELDRRLKEEGLTLKSYPSSARSATIGGWVMGSGLGIGSLRYGRVCDHLLSAEMVCADGTVRTFSREQGLDWLCETEGMLGIVTAVSLTVRKTSGSTFSQLVYFDDMKNLFDFVHVLAPAAMRPYALEIFDHRYLSLVKQSGCEVTDFAPGGGTVLVTRDNEGEQSEAGMGTVEALTALYHGEIRDGAEQEWNQRFNMLRIRRAVPTVIPIGVHIPLDKLYRFYTGMQKLNKRTIAFLGHVVSRDDCMVMPMLVTDKDDLMEFGLALHVPSKIFALARSLGGRPGGGIGVWNASYSKEVLSADKAEEIKRRKKELDPKGILNPGMWSGAPLIFKPGIYNIGMKIASRLDRIFPKHTVKAGADHGFRTCVQCGYCTNYCPTGGEWISSTPRGRILMTNEILGKEPLDSAKVPPGYLKSIFECSLCGRCAVDCSVSINSPAMWVGLRSELVKKGMELDCLKTVTKVINETHNTAAKPNDQRANWAKRLKLRSDTEEKQGGVVYFTGCVTSFFPMVQDIARAFVRIADRARFDVVLLGGEEWCCGYALISAGHIDAAAASMRHNIEAVKRTGAGTVVVTCPGCYRMWKNEYFHITGEKPGIDVFHSTEFIARLIQDNRISFKELDETATYHDPCDLGRVSGIFDEPRFILKNIPGLNFVELRDNREHCNCCGSGGDLLVSNQSLSLGIAKRKVNEILLTGAKTVITACPSCVRSLTMAKTAEKTELNVLDITQLVWKAMAT